MKKILLNPKQALFLNQLHVGSFDMAVLMSCRGSGGTAAMGMLTYIMQAELPQARGGLGGLSVKYMKAVTVPALVHTWRWALGISEYSSDNPDGDFVLWKAPPAHFRQPHQEPANWRNCITFSNGFCIELEGYKTLSAGIEKEVDFYLIADLAYFQEAWLPAVYARLRGNQERYASAYHYLVAALSSVPYTVEGQYVWDYEDLAQQSPDNYLFVQSKTADNRMFLPAGYLDGLRESLSALEYRIEVLGERMVKESGAETPKEPKATERLRWVWRPSISSESSRAVQFVQVNSEEDVRNEMRGDYDHENYR